MMPTTAATTPTPDQGHGDVRARLLKVKFIAAVPLSC
jgi:hypothetical protein